MIQLFQYPYKTLTEVSSEWSHNDTIQGYDDIEKFEHDMINLMLTEHGMGLAANQIGITKKFFAIGHETFDRFQKPVIIWNPNASSMNAITLRVLRLINELVNCDGKWQTKSKEGESD